MKFKWVAIITITLTVIGCGTKARIQETYVQMDQRYTGEVTTFKSFDEVGRSYQKVAALEITSFQHPDKLDKNKMMASLKSKAGEVGAQGVVVIDEGYTVERIKIEAGLSTFYTNYIKCVAIAYE